VSNSLKKTWEHISELLDRLAIESTRGIPIIVEGQRDMNVLQKLEIKGDIVTAKGLGKSFLDVLSEVEKRGKEEVIILMDFDRRGREWTKRLAQGFERMGIKSNLFFWNELRSLVGKEVKDVEGLAPYLETLKGKMGYKYRKN
jgi:5S rRNA maturation endonuclease (ribonuclease M5)